MDPVMLETLDRSLIFPELAAEGLEKILVRRRLLRPQEFLLHAGHRITEEGLVCSFWVFLERRLAAEPRALKRCSARLYRGGPLIVFRRVEPTLTRREDGGTKTLTVIHFRTVVDADHCVFPVPFRRRSV